MTRRGEAPTARGRGWAADVVAASVAPAGDAVAAERDTAKVRLVVADALWQAVGAQELPVARSARALARTASAGAASVVGVGRGVPAETAALANAALVHARLTDDAHPGALAHPGAVVVPTVLALAEETNAAGIALVRAIAAGYRTFGLLAAPAAETVAARGMRNTSVFGPSAAAVAAADVLGLGPRRTLAALMIAASASGGTLQAFRAGSPEWRLQPGLAAQVGIGAARWAAVADEGDLDYPAHALEGPGGLYETLGVGVRARSRLTVDAGATDAARDGLLGATFKRHATCGANQVPVEVMAELVSGGALSVGEIERVDVTLARAAHDYPGCGDRGPFTAESSFLSRPLALATTVLTGGGALTNEGIAAALGDARLPALVARVHSHVYPDGERRHPQEADVRIALRDGRVLVGNGATVLDRFREPDPHERVRAAQARIGPVAAEISARAAELPHTTAAALLAPLRAL